MKALDDYWIRFNTITIPLQDRELYFKHALIAAQTAEHHDQLEEILAAQYEKRFEELSVAARGMM